jgi:hypothetical protein
MIFLSRITEQKSYFTPSFYSSFLFLTNVCTTAYFGYITYSIGFLILFITSIIVRLKYTTFTIVLDKIPIVFITVYGGYVFYQKLQEKINILFCSGILFTFLATVYLYICIIPHPEYVALQYILQALLHFISCIGHHLIVLL